MESIFDIGDTVICYDSGVVGVIESFYTPTSCEEQTMVRTKDGRKYHAPSNSWIRYEPGGKVNAALLSLNALDYVFNKKR